MTKNKILIIGGAGFIGINAAEKFIKDGWRVTILDNLSRRGTDLNLKWLSGVFPKKYKFIKADIVSDRKILNREVGKYDAVIHLAGQVAVTTSVSSPYDDFKINALGTLHVLEAIRTSKGKKPILVYSSTNKVYGDLNEIKVVEKKTRYDFKNLVNGVDESVLLDFHSPYGCSKGAAEQYVRDYSRIYDLKTVVFRQSCIYGRHQLGVEDQGWVAWFTIASLLKKPIMLYGNGKQVRDLLFVDDLVDLYQKAIKKADIVSGEIYNVGGGRTNSLSLLEFFEKLKKNHGVTVKYKRGDIRPGDQKMFISDNSKIKKHIGWEPKTGTKEGIKELLNWTNDNLSIIKSLY
jgi:CDP-paratose 2-epimerase